MRQSPVIGEDMLVLDQAPMSPLHGNFPEQRGPEELLQNGLLILDKPRGPTSHQLVAWVRDILGVEKTGHSGTLDPNVSGVLAVGVGDGTRYLDALLAGPKEYIAVLELSHNVNKKMIRETVAEFTGRIYQFPPKEAAVVRRLRKRTIYFSNILEIVGKRVLFHVGCESGTYIRTLCYDLGRAMGVKGHMASLRRGKTAHFSEEQAVTLQDLKDAMHYYREEDNEEELMKILRPPEEVLSLYPSIIIKDSAVDAICRGAPLTVPGIAAIDPRVRKSKMVAIRSLKGEGVALARSKLHAKNAPGMKKGVAAISTRVLMRPGTYPKGW